MPLSQLLITLDSFQSLPLAGATLLRRARIWAVCADPGRPAVQPSPPCRRSAAREKPEPTGGRDCQVQCLQQPRMAALGAGVSSSGFWAGIQSAVLSSRTGRRRRPGSCLLLVPHTQRAGTMFWHLPLSLSQVGFDSVEVRMTWSSFWVAIPAAAAP